MKLHFSIEYLTHWGEDVRVYLTATDGQQKCSLQTGASDLFIIIIVYIRKAVSSGRNGTSYLDVSEPTLLKLICSGMLGRMSLSYLIFILPLLRSVSVRIRPRRKDCRISTVR